MNLLEFRLANRFTQEQAARELEVGARSISRWENGDEPTYPMKVYLEGFGITDWKRSPAGSNGAA